MPHFEKMLYDQALLVRAYLEGYQITGDESYAKVAGDVLEYVLRDTSGRRRWWWARRQHMFARIMFANRR